MLLPEKSNLFLIKRQLWAFKRRKGAWWYEGLRTADGDIREMHWEVRCCTEDPTLQPKPIVKLIVRCEGKGAVLQTRANLQLHTEQWNNFVKIQWNGVWIIHTIRTTCQTEMLVYKHVAAYLRTDYSVKKWKNYYPHVSSPIREDCFWKLFLLNHLAHN